MKLAAADIYRYRVPFRDPVSVRGLLVAHREGFVLALRAHGQNDAAFGEIAPLPGLHDETLDAAGQELASCVEKLAEACSKGTAGKNALLRHTVRLPSVRTGIEMALLNLTASAERTKPAFPGMFPAALRLPLNALLFGSSTTVLERAKDYYKEGYRTFKLKVQATQSESAAESIRALHREFGSRIELRLDANQSLGLDEAVAFGRSIPPGFVSFIEEPLQNPSEIPEFHAATALRSALDESLWQLPGLLERLPIESLGALVLKPNRLGGFAVTLGLASAALKLGIPAILSSAFESGISLGIYAWLAAVIAPEAAACGLDTFRFLESDLLQVPFKTENGSIDPDAAYLNSCRVSMNLLHPVTSWTL